MKHEAKEHSRDTVCLATSVLLAILSLSVSSGLAATFHVSPSGISSRAFSGTYRSSSGRRMGTLSKTPMPLRLR
jgi:hypothetical protein